MPRIPRGTLRERFMARIIKNATTGCWEWNGARGKDGAITIHANLGKYQHLNLTAPRAAWLIWNGDIEAGTYVDQKCGNRNCCFYEHLHLVSRSIRTGRPPEDPKVRFDRGYVVLPNGCWGWKGAKRGYGQFKWRFGHGDIRQIGAHVASYMIHHGPVPKGMHVHHKCNHPPCVNPDHLGLLTPKENICHNSSKTHCKRGHEFTKRNTYIAKDGGRVCKECRNEYHRAWHKIHGRKKSAGAGIGIKPTPANLDWITTHT